MYIVFLALMVLAFGCFIATLILDDKKKNEGEDEINPELRLKNQQIEDREKELEIRERELELMKREEQIKKRFIELKKRGIETDVDYIIANDMDKKDG